MTPALLRTRWITIASWSGLIVMALFIGGATKTGDAGIFYDVPFPPDYERSSLLTATYNWSPAFAFWIQPFQLLPWVAFQSAIALASVAALAYLVGPPAALFLVVFQVPPVWLELIEGNVNLMWAVLLVWAIRSPSWLAPIALTKVLPSVAGLWNVFRGEWGRVARAVAITVALALPAVILAPGSWGEWMASLTRNVSQAESEIAIPVIARAVVAVGLIAYAVRLDRPWLVPIAAALGGHGGNAWLMALGAWRLYRPRPWTL